MKTAIEKGDVVAVHVDSNVCFVGYVCHMPANRHDTWCIKTSKADRNHNVGTVVYIQSFTHMIKVEDRALRGSVEAQVYPIA